MLLEPGAELIHLTRRAGRRSGSSAGRRGCGIPRRPDGHDPQHLTEPARNAFGPVAPVHRRHQSGQLARPGCAFHTHEAIRSVLPPAINACFHGLALVPVIVCSPLPKALCAMCYGEIWVRHAREAARPTAIKLRKAVKRLGSWLTRPPQPLGLLTVPPP